MAGKPGIGPKKGERRGGRSKGTPNRATVEAALEAERAVEVAKKTGRKLGKEILDDFAQLFAGMAAYYQPSPKGAPLQNRNSNEEKFERYAMMAVNTAAKLAEFQSPKFRAVAVVPADDHAMPGKGFPQLPASGKAMDALAAYQLLRDKNDVIDIVPSKVETVPPVKKLNGAKKANGHG